MLHHATNAYPRVLLHDCIVHRITPMEKGLVIDFDKDGFFVQVPEAGNHFRATPARLTFTGCTLDDLDLQQTHLHRVPPLFSFRTMHRPDPARIARQVNEGSLRLEVLEEYYAAGAAWFVLAADGGLRRTLYVRLYFDTLRYEWGRVNRNSPF